MIKQFIVVEKKPLKKSKIPDYEVFHIIGVKDIKDVDTYMKQSVGVTNLKTIEAEIKEFEIQADYRKRIVDAIKYIEDNKVNSTDVDSALKGYIEWKKQEDKDLENKKKKN